MRNYCRSMFLCRSSPLHILIVYTLLTFGTDMQKTKTNRISSHTWHQQKLIWSCLVFLLTQVALPGIAPGCCPHFLAHIYKNQRCQSSWNFLISGNLCTIGRIIKGFRILLLVSGFVDNTDCHLWKIARIHRNSPPPHVFFNFRLI